MVRSFVFLFGVALALPVAAQSQASRFDGEWNVEMKCPPTQNNDGDAKGYTHRFPATITNGQLEGRHKSEGEPGFHHLRGKVGADGSANLRLDGIVNNPDYAINNAERGKVYSYRIKAQFAERTGQGARLTGRTCDFRFTR